MSQLFQPPTTALFTLSNDASGVTTSIVDDGTRGYSFKRTDTGASSTERVSFRGKAVPAGSSWECVLGMKWAVSGSTEVHRYGLALLENSSGKSLFICANNENGTTKVTVFYFTALGTFSSAPFSLATIGARPELLKVAYDGTNYIFSVSFDDGISWQVVSTLAKASYFTADRVGVIVETFGTYNFLPGMLAYYYNDPDV